MLVICEDCAKKYNVDESRIQGDRARFACRECGHIIIVEKKTEKINKSTLEELSLDQGVTTDFAENTEPEETAIDSEKSMDAPTQAAETSIKPEVTTKSSANQTTGKGFPIVSYLLLALATGFLSILATLGYLYFRYIPQLLNEQIDLRTSAIASSFQGVVQQPLMVRNYLEVNKEAERFSRLPGVAYAAVLNNRNVVVAGYFSDLGRFDLGFAQQVKSKGFPLSLFDPKTAGTRSSKGDLIVQIGDQKIQDKKLPIEGGGVIHIGVYVSEIKAIIKDALLSPVSLALLGIILFSGIFAALLLARFVTQPLRKLTDLVNRISLGELDLSITAQGPREIRELSIAFERMRYSIKTALERLQRK